MDSKAGTWKDVRVCIGLCNNQGYMQSEFFWNFLDLLKPTEYVVIRGRAHNKSSSLNQIVMEAHRWKVNKILFLDIDQTFPFDTIPKLLSRNLPIVSGLTYMRGHPYSPLAGWVDKEGIYVNSEGSPWKESYAPFPNNETNLVEVDWTSVGCLMVDLDVFNKVHFPSFFDIWDTEFNGARRKGHDINFCDAAKAAGYQIYIDNLVQCGHLTTNTIDEVYVKAYHSSGHHEKAVEIVREAATNKQYWDERHFGDKVKRLKRVYPGEWDYIVEQLPVGSSVAEVGCGPGFLMDQMIADKQCDCYGYDLSSVAIDILKQRGMQGEVADFRDPKPNGKLFDHVVSSHVLEHMVDDVAFLKNLASLLKDKNGKVIVAVPTENVGLISELEHQRVYDADSLKVTLEKVFKEVHIALKPRDREGKLLSPMLVGIGSRPHGI